MTQAKDSTNSEMIQFLEMENRALMGKPLNQSFILSQVRKYNQAVRQLYRDNALLAIGIHTGLLQKRVAIASELTQVERDRVLYFCRQFLKSNHIQAEIKEQKAPH